MKKKNKRQLLKVLNTDIYVWCIRNGYRIYPITKDNVKFQVAVSKAHQNALLSTIYNEKTIHSGIIDCYNSIYNKQNK